MSDAPPESFCLIAASPGVSGTERVMADLCLLAQRSGRKSTHLLLCDVPATRPYARPLVEAGATVAYFPGVQLRKYFAQNLAAGLRFFRARRPRIAHFHCPSYRWGLDLVAAAMLAKVPRIVRTEQNPLMAMPEPQFRGLLARTDARVCAFTYVSEGNRRRFETLLPYRAGRGTVICNGIDPSRFCPALDAGRAARVRAEFGMPPDALVAIFVGTWGDRRSLVPVFRALQSVRNRGDALAGRWRLLIVGDGDPAERDLPARMGLETCVHFAGRRSDVYEFLPYCDLFVSTSHYEGQSIAILEAWASGLDVLVMEVDGIEDVLGAEQAARIMVSQGDVDGFADRWHALTAPSARGARLQQPAASERVRSHFTTARMLDTYLSLYEQL